MQDNSFSPANVTINVNDTVQWNWTGINQHSSTGPGTTPLWNSGLHGNGFTFSFQFTSAGSYAYICTLHSAIGMTGNVTVQAPNVPPTISLTAPTNNANFAAPWTGTLKSSQSDPDDTISRVDFVSGGTTVLGTVLSPASTASLNVTNLAAGTYTLTAKATDSRGASTTSSGVTIHVLTPVPIVLGSAQQPSSTSFQFDYSATPGLKYVVQRSADLTNFTSLVTNTAVSSPVTFLDTNAPAAAGFYRVQLQPNP